MGIPTAILFLLIFNWAHASPEHTPVSRSVGCGILQTYGGEIQILDPSRTQILDLFAKTPIPCGSWISVQSGWVQIKHPQGFILSASGGTFIQLVDYNKNDSARDPEHAVLFKGQVHVYARESKAEIRILTPNSRARFKDGESMVVYSQADELSQMVVLQKTGSFENRFESDRRVQLKAGEASTMSFDAARIIPTSPQVAQAAEVKARLSGFRLEDQVVENALAHLKQRSERVFAAELGKAAPSRAPAGLERYDRHPTHGQAEVEKQDRKLMQHLVRKVAGGQRKAGDLLYPDEKALRKDEAIERARLVKELAQIRSD